MRSSLRCRRRLRLPLLLFGALAWRPGGALVAQPQPVPAPLRDTPLRDTLIAQGRQDFTAYTTPGMCLAAAVSEERIATRAQYDTTAYMPAHDTVATVTAVTARRCGARFAVDRVPVGELLDVLHLALLIGNDTFAQAAEARYVAAAPSDAARRWALYAVDTSYLHAHPVRLTAAEAVTARLDAMGPAAALQRASAHQQLLFEAEARFDSVRIAREAIAALQAHVQIQGSDTLDVDAGAGAGGPVSLFYAALYDDPASAWAKTVALIKPTGFQHLDWLQHTLHNMRFDWAITQVGTAVPKLAAAHWAPAAGRPAGWPEAGRVSICIHGPREWDPKEVAMWRRLLTKYGSVLNVTILDKTVGFVRSGPPATPAEEAAQLGRFYHDTLQLPVTVALQESAVQQLPPPDGRRLYGAAPFEQDPYYTMETLLIDRTGRIIMLFPVTPSEPMLEAWIARAVGVRDGRPVTP